MNRTFVAAALACTTLAGCYYPYGYYPGGYYTAAPVPVQPAPVYVDPAPPTTIRRRRMRPRGAVTGARRCRSISVSADAAAGVITDRPRRTRPVTRPEQQAAEFPFLVVSSDPETTVR